MNRLHQDKWLMFVIFVVVVCSVCGVLTGRALGEAQAWGDFHAQQAAIKEHAEEVAAVNDVPYEEPSEEASGYVFDEATDLQNPELPTGCEATALATTLRMNGIEVSKEDVADAMPKTDGSDFVNAFWGDPYSEYGWACMSPCVVETAKRFLPVEKTVVNLTGTNLVYLPTPCVVWVTMGIEGAIPSGREQGGYELLWNPHCVTLVAAGEATVTCIDPLEGEVVYPFSKFNAAYMANGSQAVYIADRGYKPTE